MISGRKAGLEARVFLALDLPEPVRASCEQLAAELRRRKQGDAVRWVRPEGTHVTLRFLGNVVVEHLPEIAKRVGEALADVPPFRVELGAPRLFPRGSKPRVVILDVLPEEALRSLAARVEQGCVAAGLAPEKRTYHPHLTLGRLRARRAPALDDVALSGADAFEAREVVLFRSELTRSGAIYTPLESMPLGGLTGSPVSP